MRFTTRTLMGVLLAAGAANAAECGMTPGSEGFRRPWSMHLALAGDPAAITDAPDGILSAIAAVKEHRPQQAIGYLSVMNRSATRPEQISTIAYWGAQAWDQMGNHAQAVKLLDIARRSPNTFYGQLAGGTPDGSIGQYPTIRFRYIDPRTDYALVWAVIRQESRFHVTARSDKNALGLMQVIPSTAEAVATSFGAHAETDRIITDPHYAVAIGSTWLGYLYRKYGGDVPLTLAAYNAGEKCADTWSATIGDPRKKSTDGLLWVESIPYDETRDYVKSVLANYFVYKNGIARP